MPDTPFDPLKCAGAEIDRIPPCEHLLVDPTVPTTPGDVPGNPNSVELIQTLPSLAAGGPLAPADLTVLADQLADVLPAGPASPGQLFTAYLTCRHNGDHGWYNPENGAQGYPATFLSVSSTVRGDGSTAEVQQVRVFSAPLSAGTWTLGGAVNLAYNISAIALETELQFALGELVTVTALNPDTDGFFELGFEVTWPGVGSQALLTGDISGMAVAALNPARNLAPYPGTLWNSAGYGYNAPGGEVMLWLNDTDGVYYFTETPCPVLLLVDSAITTGGAEHVWRANIDPIAFDGTPFNDQLLGVLRNQDIGEVVLWDPVGVYKSGDLILANITNETFEDGGSGHGVELKDVYQVTVDTDLERDKWRWTSVQTSNYTATVGEAVLVDASGGNVTITLPAAKAKNDKVLVEVLEPLSPYTVTVDGNGSDKVDAVSSHLCRTKGYSVFVWTDDATVGWASFPENVATFAKSASAPTDVAGPISPATIYAYTETGLTLGEYSGEGEGLRLLPATATQQGAVSTGTQTFGGNKAFVADRVYVVQDSDIDPDDGTNFDNGIEFLSDDGPGYPKIRGKASTSYTQIVLAGYSVPFFSFYSEGTSGGWGTAVASTESGDWTFRIAGDGDARFAVERSATIYYGETGSVAGIEFHGGLVTTIPADLAYTPASSTDWDGADPTTIKAALDRLAAAVKAGSTTI